MMLAGQGRGCLLWQTPGEVVAAWPSWRMPPSPSLMGLTQPPAALFQRKSLLPMFTGGSEADWSASRLPSSWATPVGLRAWPAVAGGGRHVERIKLTGRAWLMVGDFNAEP